MSRLPHKDAEDLAQRLIKAAAAMDGDGGAALGELCGKASLDPRLAGTVLGILAKAVADLSARREA